MNTYDTSSMTDEDNGAQTQRINGVPTILHEGLGQEKVNITTIDGEATWCRSVDKDEQQGPSKEHVYMYIITYALWSILQYLNLQMDIRQALEQKPC